MSPELLALIEALDAVKESPGTKSQEGERLKAIYEARLDALLERHPNLTRQLAQSMIELAYSRWQRAQQKPASIPPRA